MSPRKGDIFCHPGGVTPLLRPRGRKPRRRRGTFLRLHRSAVFYSDAVTVPSATISFPSCGKRYGRKGRWGRGIALTRLKSLSFRFACYRYTVRSPNALRAAVESGFPSARHAVRVASFAPVEYLTYGSRKAVLPARAALHIAKNGLPFKLQLK